MFRHFTIRQLILLSILPSALCIVYFSLLDHAVFYSTRFSPIFKSLLAQDDARSAWLMMFCCLAAALWKWPKSSGALADFLGAHPGTIAAAAAAALALGCVFVYHAYPLCMDEYSAVFQSKIFARGRIAAQLPPELIDWLVAPGFNGVFLIASHASGAAIEAYWPGFALLLAPFQYFQIPWLCNPLLAAMALY